jgi:hypothetical protein
MRESFVLACLLVGCVGISSVAVRGQEQPASPDASVVVAGPPPPEAPDSIARDASGQATLRAAPLRGTLRIDGLLTEDVYTAVRPMSGFTQVDPMAGAPASDDTEIWVFFDSENLYVAARCFESYPDRLVANELRRDHNNIPQNDNIAFAFDTFFDRRTGVVFETTPIAARLDAQYVGQGRANYDWNPIWDVEVTRDDRGWTVEASIPFKSLRYQAGRTQTWGFNVRRHHRWRNEVTFLNPVPASLGMGGIFQSAQAAPMVGIEAPPGSKSLEIKPYVVASLSTDRTVSPVVSNDLGGDAGLDLKYGVTQNLTANFTYNTDFAQVEVDDQQVNLTRFQLFFPEKREFFLENRGLFSFGGGFSGPSLFFSRRIGLVGGQQVPIIGGGRLTGRVGQFNLGLLSIQADEEPDSGVAATNFSVIRVSRDILRRSSIGFILTNRSVSLGGDGANRAFGADARFAFFTDLTINTFWARTITPGLSGDDVSYRGRVNYGGDRYGFEAERLVIGAEFNPEIGFVRRADMRRSFGQVRFSPRPRNSTLVRKYSLSGSVNYIENGAGRLETREVNGRFGVELQNSDQLEVEYTGSFEFLSDPFPISTDVELPIGGYDFNRVRSSYSFGRQRVASGRASFEFGTFFSGHRTSLSVGGARVNLTPRFSVEPTVSINRVELAEGSFTTNLIGSRVTFTMTPRMFTSALLQYNSSGNNVSANVRLRWEYVPGSELFVVYNEQRDTRTLRFPGLTNRALIVKINRLFQL